MQKPLPNEMHHLFEDFDVIDQGIQMHSDQVDKPEEIRNEKYLAKGDQIVDRAVDRIILIDLIHLLCKEEERPVYQPIQKQPKMPEFIRIQV